MAVFDFGHHRLLHGRHIAVFLITLFNHTGKDKSSSKGSCRCWFTPCPDKKGATLFLTITMIIFDRFWYFSTTGNRNEYSTKHVQTVSLQSDYVSTLRGKTKNDKKQPLAYAVHSVELIVPDFWRKSFSVRFFPYSFVHFFSSLPTKNLLHSRWFYQKFIFKLNMVNFNM